MIAITAISVSYIIGSLDHMPLPGGYGTFEPLLPLKLWCLIMKEASLAEIVRKLLYKGLTLTPQYFCMLVVDVSIQ